MSDSPENISAAIPETEVGIGLIIGRINKRLAAVQLADTRGVIIPGKVTPIPGSPKSLSGLVYFRGGIEAVVNLGVVWGEGTTEVPDSSRAMLLEAEGMRAVVIFDELIDLYECPKNDLRDPEIGLAGISNVFSWHDRSVFLLSGSDLLRYVEAYVSLNLHKR